MSDFALESTSPLRLLLMNRAISEADSSPGSLGPLRVFGSLMNLGHRASRPLARL